MAKKTKITQEGIIRSFTNEISDDQRKNLVDWLADDPANLKEYNRLREIWERSSNVLATDRDQFEQSWQRFLFSTRKKSAVIQRTSFLVWRIAAAVALLAGLTATMVWLVPWNSHKPVQMVQAEPEKAYIITPEGEKVILADDQSEIRYDSIAPTHPGLAGPGRGHKGETGMIEVVVPRSRRISVVLADGSKVWLNSESRFRYPGYFEGATRTVSLEGEALFEVKKDSGRPFVVSTRDISINVLGTTFNVTAYANESQISTTLVEGSVELRKNGSGEKQMLKPNQRAVYSSDKQTFQVDETDTELYTCWIHGYLKFSSESLEEVISKLVRNYGISMKIAVPALKDYKFSGKLDMQENVNQVLEVIRLAAPVDYREENGTILIINKNE